jgi:hypothetical protein
VRGSATRAGNLGDAASAVVVAAISGLAPAHRNLDTDVTRMAAIGTIGQNLRFGEVHLWGTGVDAGRRAFGTLTQAFAAAPKTEYVVHATRGPLSRRTLIEAGLHAPAIYGDGAWFLPRIVRPPAETERRYELGVIPHISELAELTTGATPRGARYGGGGSDGVRIISTLHPPNWAGFRSKMQELLSCKRIVSNSFHGMLIADAFGIPNAYFAPRAGGAQRASIQSEAGGVNHRFRDFYLGAGLSEVPSFAQPLDTATPWDRVIRAVDELWAPVSHARQEAFFDAFPATRCVSLQDEQWPVGELLPADLLL